MVAQHIRKRGVGISPELRGAHGSSVMPQEQPPDPRAGREVERSLLMLVRVWPPEAPAAGWQGSSSRMKICPRRIELVAR